MCPFFLRTDASTRPQVLLLQLILLACVLLTNGQQEPFKVMDEITRDGQLESADLKLEDSFSSTNSRLKSAASLLQQQNQQQLLQSQQLSQDLYRCAKFCSCSTVQVASIHNRPGANLTLAKCESAQFSDLLTIDRRTQIIHISLPSYSDDNNANRGAIVSANDQRQSSKNFRMPRLNQFSSLRELVIVNLRLQVCDSEVFRRGSKIRRLRLNSNHLIRMSKSCLKFLDKLVELNLDHNQLDELESALFSGLLSLKHLSIAYNQLTDLAAHQFANLSQLNSLNLVGNSFKTINLHLFEPMQTSLRSLMLSKNKIKSFVYIQQASTSTSNQRGVSSLTGVLFKNLVKLNVDSNKFERIKLLQLHRFFNVKFLSIRFNQISSIRDRAFNGLKLIELNLANNQLQSLSRCAFCNATIKRLIMANNNITLPPVVNPVLQAQPVQVGPTAGQLVTPLVSANLVLHGTGQPNAVSATSQQQQNMLILSQSLLGPLFAHLEYLDLAGNEQLLQVAPDQLDLLLEPLLKLEYLSLSMVGLDKSLPSPRVFKNLRQLKYLNLSHNQLDQIAAETVETLELLEVLDLSHNKFSEIEESFLVGTEELPNLRMLNLGSNPWFCSQCKIAPLYEWIFRSSLYNYTCIAPSISGQSAEDFNSTDSSQVTSNQVWDLSPLIHGDEFLSGSLDPAVSSASADRADEAVAILEFDQTMSNSAKDHNGNPQAGDHLLADYNLLTNRPGLTLADQSPISSTGASWLTELASEEDDQSVSKVIQALVDPQLAFGSMPSEFCLRCEFPSDLRQYQLHELGPGDFKFCAGAAPRFAASEPKIGLTLAIVIISALLCIIIVVIFMYRKKSSTFYQPDDTDQLGRSNGDGGSRAGSGFGKRGQQVASISSDAELQYADGTDYSSPPVSQSYESSFSQGEAEDDYDEDEEGLEEEEEIVEDFDDDDGLEEEEELEDIDADGRHTEETKSHLDVAPKLETKTNDIGKPIATNDMDKAHLSRQISGEPSRNSSTPRRMGSSAGRPAGPSRAPSGRQSSRAPTGDSSLTGQVVETSTPTVASSTLPSRHLASTKTVAESQSSSASVERAPKSGLSATEFAMPRVRRLDQKSSIEGSQSVKSLTSSRASGGSLGARRANTIQTDRNPALANSSKPTPSSIMVDSPNPLSMPNATPSQPQMTLSSAGLAKVKSSDGVPGPTNTRASQTTPSMLEQPNTTGLRTPSSTGARLALARQSPTGPEWRSRSRPMRLSNVGSEMVSQAHLHQRQLNEMQGSSIDNRRADLMSPSFSSDATTADSLALEALDYLNGDQINLVRPAEGHLDDDNSSYEPDPDEHQGGAALICESDDINFERRNC